MDSAPVKISGKWLLIDIAGAILSAIGIYQLMEPGGSQIVGGACLIVGIPMMGIAVVQLLQRVRAPRRPS